MQFLHQERAYSFRSPGLFLFLRLLLEAAPGWIDLAGIRQHMPGIDPRQLARFVDLLEARGLPLVHYETKTRGRFRLAVSPEQLTLPAGPYRPRQAAFRSPVDSPSVLSPRLADYQNEAWVAWVVALVHSTQALHSGHLSGKDSALDHLEAAEAASRTLPVWTVSIVHLRRAHILERASRYREAAFWLRRVDTAVRQGTAHPATQGRAQLVRAKMRYDQARYEEAERVLESLPEEVGQACPHRLNMKALVSGRKFLSASEAESEGLLARTLAALAEALGYVFLWHSDTSLLDALCYNFGNNMLRGIKRGLIPKARADTVMQWLAANMLVCRKLGVGEDSILANLLLIDVGLEHGNSVERWPHLLRYGSDFYGDLDVLLDKTLKQARQTGNRLEIAQCLRRQVQLAASSDEAARAYFEAVALFAEQGRKDVVAELAEDWRDRFGTSPPMPPTGHGT